MVDGCVVVSSGTEAEAVSFTDWQAGYVPKSLAVPGPVPFFKAPSPEMAGATRVEEQTVVMPGASFC
jgi:hypothetical protein